jgi:hypothetical protein
MSWSAGTVFLLFVSSLGVWTQSSTTIVRPLLIALVFAVCSFGSLAQAIPTPSPQTPAQKQSQPNEPIRASKHSDLPAKGEFQDNQFVELAPDQDRRVVRESRHKNTFHEITDPADTSAPGEGEDYIVKIDDYAQPLDPFPLARSAAVVIGTVLSSKAFVSKDHTYVYSDYQVRVDQVLKQDPSANLVVGGRIVASKESGTIHFPSGRIRNYISQGEGYPAIGSQYLFFLVKPDFPEPEYEMFTGAVYELINGRVQPLDDEQLGRFDEMREPVFMEKVEQAIASQNGVKP